jgi:hypothetical protein
VAIRDWLAGMVVERPLMAWVWTIHGWSMWLLESRRHKVRLSQREYERWWLLLTLQIGAMMNDGHNLRDA